MNDKQKTIAYALAALVVLAVLIFVLCLFQGAYAQTIQEPILEPQVEETITYPEETENTPETANESVTEVFTEPEPQQVYAEVESCDESGVITKHGGVNYHDGRKECWYSSNVLYHRDTDQWELDEEGFYRTDEGYYVVAASDMEYGTVFEGSKGMCQVLDCGCAEGTTDYYVRW